ncbi:serine/threonine-protein kinase [Litorilituus sediminis]|uniref:Serine/threonine-protein kinase n=1 Tax=Litorilituus sediminis TaxID=718192 RepID=A0A4P6P5U3_9GAMM|nr:serine/threonine-protein kinase [Litorilituus sediminis]QBG36863.1 serine/threonine-protein kinase [Litorilituus sediminis]
MVNMQGQYSKIRLLGEGGMGKVYLAQDNKLERQVAIKELTALSGEQSLEHALAEARILARLSHANIIQIYNVYEQNNQAALVMEYFHSQSLSQYQKENQLSMVEKLELLRQLTSGLKAAHQHGIIHCDLKPSNILINKQGQLKIADFGIARLAGQEQGIESDSSAGYGCLFYMSPEHIARQALDYRTDIFSLGIIAYQLLVGSHPFGQGSANQVAERICQQVPEHAKNLLCDAPAALTDLLMAMLVKPVAKRTLTAAEIENRLGHILMQWQQNLDSEQATLPLPEPITKKQHGFSAIKLFSGACLLCLLVLFAFYFVSQDESDNKHVAILKPRLIENSAMPAAQQALVLSTVEDAMRQAVINTKNMYLISQREVMATTALLGDNLAKLKQALGASDLITTSLECDTNRCNVRFARLTSRPNNAEHLSVSAENHWFLLIEKFSVMYSASQGQFAALFAKELAVNKAGLLQKPIKESDYQRYINLYHEIKEQRQYNEHSLSKLAELLTRSPYLYAAYALYRDTALDLYLDSRDKKYLQQLDSLLQNAPPEYRYSVYEAIDRFWLASDLGQMDVAQQQITEAKHRGADALLILEQQAYMHFSSGHYDKAAQAYTDAYKLRPSLSLLYNSAFSYWRMGALSEAEKTIESLLKQYPNNIKGKRLQANIWLLQGQLASAIAAYQAIVNINPQSSDLTNLALAYALNKQYKKSLEFAQKALAKAPKHPFNLLNLADIEMMMGDKQLAKSHYQQVVSLLVGKNEVKYLTNLAQAYAQLGQADLAIATINKAQELTSDNGEVSYASALVYSLLNEKSSAIHHVKVALKNNVGAVWYNLPWFDALCREAQFKKLMDSHANTGRCNN